MGYVLRAERSLPRANIRRSGNPAQREGLAQRRGCAVRFGGEAHHTPHPRVPQPGTRLEER